MRIHGQRLPSPRVLNQVVVLTPNQDPHQAQNQVVLTPTQTQHQIQTLSPPQSLRVKRKNQKSENTHLTVNHGKTTNGAVHPAETKTADAPAHEDEAAQETEREGDRGLPLIFLVARNITKFSGFEIFLSSKSVYHSPADMEKDKYLEKGGLDLRRELHPLMYYCKHDR